MRSIAKLLLLPYFLFASISHAKVSSSSLYEWRPEGTLAPLIIFVKNNETPETAAKRYLRELEKQPDLMELFGGKSPALEFSNFTPLSDKNRESRALLVANLPKDYGPQSLRVQNFIEIFKEAKHDSYILPMNASLGLTVAENARFMDQIADRFPYLVVMGGDDVAPEFYKEHHTFSNIAAPKRDQFEISLIKSYVKSGKGFLLGVCRGSQISAVALGYKLIQDVPIFVGKDVAHANDWHKIKLFPTPHNILGSLAVNSELTVNSLHHQAVRLHNEGPLALAASSEDGVVEATELKNGKGLLLQFHPELMENSLGSRILHQTLVQKNSVIRFRCENLF
jgi:putative glutamine amidotransferase